MQIENHTIPVPYNSRLNQTAKSTMAGHKDGTKQVLSYRKNMRTAGTIAVWTPTSTPPFTLPEKALNEAITAKEMGAHSFVPEKIMSYAGTQKNMMEAVPEKRTEEPFGLGDIIDIVNPLHHLPLIGHIYREVSGDDIMPISRIIGGAVYGGGVGAGTALVNVIVEHDTGHDVAENIVKFAASPLQKAQAKDDLDNPQPALPAQLLRYTNLPDTSGITEDSPVAPHEKARGWTSFTLNG